MADDKNICSISALCPSLSKSQRFLKWASNQLPPTWSSQLATLSGGLPELWRDGSLLCALINSSVPGACPNPHRHWRKPPSHGQTIAFKYLGVEPVSWYYVKTKSSRMTALTFDIIEHTKHIISLYCAKARPRISPRNLFATTEN